MKKKFLLLLTVVILFATVNVHAAEVPKIIRYGDYTYSIEGIELEIYNIVDSDETTNSDESTNFLENYIKNQPQDTINLNMNNFTLNPVFSEEKINDYNFYIIDLNVDLTEEKLVNILSEQINNVNEDLNYYIAINVQYKILSYPSQYTSIRDMNILRTLFNIFSEDKVNDIINPTEINEQTINIMAVGYDTAAQAPIIEYYDSITDENSLEAMISNYHYYLGEGDGNGGTLPNREVMFHNISNPDVLVTKLRESLENNEFDPDNYEDPITSTNNQTTTQWVNVENTSQNKSLQQLLFAVLLILIGAGAVIFIMVKQQQLYNN